MQKSYRCKGEINVVAALQVIAGVSSYPWKLLFLKKIKQIYLIKNIINNYEKTQKILSPPF